MLVSVPSPTTIPLKRNATFPASLMLGSSEGAPAIGAPGPAILTNEYSVAPAVAASGSAAAAKRTVRVIEIMRAPGGDRRWIIRCGSARCISEADPGDARQKSEDTRHHPSFARDTRKAGARASTLTFAPHAWDAAPSE